MVNMELGCKQIWSGKPDCRSLNEKQECHLSINATASGISGFAYHLHRLDPCNDNLSAHKC